ncbi:MAG: helix-hairpin-helix domain-containing protein [Acidimicrobiales bacterium]
MASIIRPPVDTRSPDDGESNERDLDLDPLVLGSGGVRRPGPTPWGEPLERLRERWGNAFSVGRLASMAVVLVVLVGGGWWLLRPAAPPIDANLPRAGQSGGSASGVTVPGTGVSGAGGAAGGPSVPGATTNALGASTTVSAELVVQAAGAVVRPGVYHLPSGGRVDDLVRTAGGLTPDADVDRVNLAGPLADGERVWVPHRGQTEVPEVVAGAPGGGGSNGPGLGGAGSPSRSTTPTGPVDLNTATAEQLDTLPGVGPATATAILAYREEHGRFGSVDELLDVRGIGDAKMEQLRPLVTA